MIAILNFYDNPRLNDVELVQKGEKKLCLIH